MRSATERGASRRAQLEVGALRREREERPHRDVRALALLQTPEEDDAGVRALRGGLRREPCDVHPVGDQRERVGRQAEHAPVERRRDRTHGGEHVPRADESARRTADRPVQPGQGTALGGRVEREDARDAAPAHGAGAARGRTERRESDDRDERLMDMDDVGPRAAQHRDEARPGRRGEGDRCARAVGRDAHGPTDPDEGRGAGVVSVPGRTAIRRRARAEHHDLIPGLAQRCGEREHVGLHTADDVERIRAHERDPHAGASSRASHAARAALRQSPPLRHSATTGWSGSRSASQFGTKTCHCVGSSAMSSSSWCAITCVPS